MRHQSSSPIRQAAPADDDLVTITVGADLVVRTPRESALAQEPDAYPRSAREWQVARVMGHGDYVRGWNDGRLAGLAEAVDNAQEPERFAARMRTLARTEATENHGPAWADLVAGGGDAA